MQLVGEYKENAEMWEACDRALAYNHDDDYDDADREALTASIPPLEPPMPPTKLRTVAQKDAERLRDKLRKAKQRKNIKEKASRKAAAASLADSLSAPPLLDSISAATAAALSDEETTVKPDLSTKEGRSEYNRADYQKRKAVEMVDGETPTKRTYNRTHFPKRKPGNQGFRKPKRLDAGVDYAASLLTKDQETRTKNYSTLPSVVTWFSFALRACAMSPTVT
ncbi:hypothetical protein T484DRAFT_1844782, partial [Baffinella frigidus]